MKNGSGMTRRQFIKSGALAGGGLLLACHLPLAAREALAAGRDEFAPNAFLRIGPDDSVTVIVNKSEMGQGVYTSLPMLLAEELCCDWKKVNFKAAPVSNEYNHASFGPIMVTGGSTSVRSEWERLSLAGAAAREMLVAAAARQWKVSPSACRADNGKVFGPGGRQLSFGKLAARAAKLPVPKEPKLKSGAKKLLGTAVKRLDSPAKINGSAVFGIDVQVPGMLSAVIARPPVFGARVKDFDAVKARSVPGVKDIFAIRHGVAVVAEGLWPALKARDLLTVSWEEGQGAAVSTPAMREQYLRLAETPGMTAQKKGDAPAVLAKATEKVEVLFELPYLAHAPMEPLNCFVDLREGSCLIRTGSQFQTIDRNAAASVAGLKPEQVTLETTFLGGGFGRRACTGSDYVIDAVQVAKVVKRPVMVIRTREDDMRAGYYRPMWVNRITACLDARGLPLAWHHRIVGQSIIAGTAFEPVMIEKGIDSTSVEGAADTPYDIPNLQVELHSPKSPVPVLWWRSVGHSHTAFVMESFIDELAARAGQDPFQYRRQLLGKHPRLLKALESAARMAGWGNPLPKGRGRGIAVHESFGSIVAQVAEASLDDKGNVRVHRVFCAIDCGRIVNPDTIKAQMESGITFGLSAALYGAITLKDGRVQQGNFHDYPIVRMDAMPAVEVQVIASDEAPGGVGEPGVPPIAPAVANALYAACGARVRSLPLTAEKIAAALKKG